MTREELLDYLKTAVRKKSGRFLGSLWKGYVGFQKYVQMDFH